jgi:putative flavoprotein involved in K+ transport
MIESAGSRGSGEEDLEAVVCGAGTAGLSAAAMLNKAGVHTRVLERTTQVAASWRRRYDTLRLNTLGWMSTQPGLHVGRRYSHFPHRDEWVRYLERYADHHRLQIQFETDVSRIERGDHGWRVETSKGLLKARHVVVATGYDHDPFIPNWPGREGFTGELVHAAEYRNAAPFRDRDVLVVGPNVTGVEVAFYIAEGGAERVRVAVRTPPNLFPRMWLGVPLNTTGLVLDRLPSRLADRIGWLAQRMIYGDLAPYGLQRSPMGVASTIRERGLGPAIDPGFVGAVKEGWIGIVAAVDGFDGPDVCLADGSRIQPEVVIAATGYRRGLEPLVGHLGVLDPDGRPIVNGARTHPSAPGLHFIGYATVLSGQLRQMRIDAKRIARAVASSRRAMEAK